MRGFFTLHHGVVAGYCQTTIWSQGDMQFGNKLIPAYVTNGNKFMNTITRIDIAGNIKWVRRTNLNLVKILSSGSLVHVVGRVFSGIQIRTNKTELTMHLYDKLGRKLLTKGFSSGKAGVDVSFLPKGMYILDVFSKGIFLKTRKIIRQ